MHFPLDELQTKLGYQFENIQLLHEALTHNFDAAKNPHWDIFNDGNVFYKKRKLHRLKRVGKSVLKLLIAEKAIVAQHDSKETYLSAEGNLTQRCHLFSGENFYYLIWYGLRLWEYIHRSNIVDPILLTISKEVIQAIFGAVFIDAGGCESTNMHAMNSASKLFDWLFSNFVVPGKACVESKDLYRCFHANDYDVRTWLMQRQYALDIQPFWCLEEKIGYEFKSPHLITTALTHDSVKGLLNGIPHYEILEFLGDAVYELIICEYLFWHYINDVAGKCFNCKTLNKFVSKKFQLVIANGIKMEKFIIKPDHVRVKDTHDFLESVVGAIYIDAKNLSLVKRVLISLCLLFGQETAESCNIRLPFTWRTFYGSWHYRQDKQLEQKIVRQLELPPERQEIFKVLNYRKLTSRLEKYYQPGKHSGTIQSYESKVKIGGSESWCNQQEFGRVSLYQTWIKLGYLENKGYDYKTKIMRDHDYSCNNFGNQDNCRKPEYAFTTNFYAQQSSKLKNVNVSEPTFEDACIAAQIMVLWIFRWAMYIFYIFIKVGLIFVGVFLATTIIVLGLVFMQYVADSVFKLR